MSSITINFVTIHVRNSAQAVPLAAANLATALPRKYHRQLNLIDAYLCESDAQIIAKISRYLPENSEHKSCLCFSLYVWNRQRVLNLARELRQLYPTTTLLVGGPEASACQQQLSELHLFDGVIAGEGELTLPGMIESLTGSGHDPQVAAPAMSPVVDMSQHISPWLSSTLKPDHGVLWETARGCPFNCAFCYDARGSHGVREIPVQRLTQELQLFDKQQVAQIWVLDSTFNYPASRGKKLLQLIAKHAPHCHFHLEAKAEFLDEETVELLQQINCSVQVGLQSARTEILQHINRALDIDKFSRKVQMLSDAGVTFGIDLIYGLPGDDVEGLRHSINFALQFYPNQIEIFPLALLPGTRLHADQQRFGIKAQQQPPYSIIHSASMTEEQLLQCQKLAAATAIFYNTGRAMAYFLPLCRACNLTALQLIESFSLWLDSDNTTKQMQEGRWWTVDWSAQQVLQMQQRFVPRLLAMHGVEHLTALAVDIILLHSCWSDTMIGPETVAQIEPTIQFDDEALLKQPWQLAPTVRIKQFSYAVDVLSTIDDLDLIEMYETMEQHPSIGLFLRRGEEVYCEAIDDIFATLLTHSNSSQPPEQILAPFSGAITPQECCELVDFALREGLLLSATPD